LPTLELAGLCYAWGDAYYRAKDAVNAVVTFARGVALHKTYRDNYFGLAVIFVNNGMFDAAVGVLEEALKNTKQEFFWMEDSLTWSWGLYDLLGVTYYQLGEFDKAIACAARALTYEPSNPRLQSNYNMYLQAKR